MTIYITKEGDILDMICFRFYGKTSGAMELVLSANQGLAEKGDIYEADIPIVLPPLKNQEIKDERTETSLWED